MSRRFQAGSSATAYSTTSNSTTAASFMAPACRPSTLRCPCRHRGASRCLGRGAYRPSTCRCTCGRRGTSRCLGRWVGRPSTRRCTRCHRSASWCLSRGAGGFLTRRCTWRCRKRRGGSRLAITVAAAQQHIQQGSGCDTQLNGFRALRQAGRPATLPRQSQSRRAAAYPA